MRIDESKRVEFRRNSQILEPEVPKEEKGKHNQEACWSFRRREGRHVEKKKTSNRRRFFE